MTLLGSSMIFLGAAVIAVPLFQRLKLGAILGYLVAGVIIGPAVVNLVSEPDTILHFAELGVVLLLFVIGLELEPEKLWRMRNDILLTGGGQLLVSAVVIGGALFLLFDLSLISSLIIGLSVALSSTAFAIQLMNEQHILRTPPGQHGFAVLLMQDLAVIPILLLVESLAPASTAQSAPAWWISALAVVAVLVVGRFLINPFLRVVTRYGSTESMTAAALLIVIATALGMQAAGLSMGMGAFVAGILLANSSFKHQLETEIAPFKGLLLGLFFIAIGMNLDLTLLIEEPWFIVGASIGLMVLKGLVLFGILRWRKQSNTDAMRVGLMLSQGGEFAFVVMAQAGVSGLLDIRIADQVTLIVGLSMALTSPVVILHSLFFSSRNCPPVYDTSSEQEEPKVMIAGFGRFGQIAARILHAHQIPFTALDKDAEQIEFVRKFGNKVFYGDACRLDILRTAGIEHAKVLLIAVDDEDAVLKIAHLVRVQCPEVKIIARARNRFTVRKLAEMGIEHSYRELYGSSLKAATRVMMEYGYSQSEAEEMARVFEAFDTQQLASTLNVSMDEEQMIERSQRARTELQELFQKDRQGI